VIMKEEAPVMTVAHSVVYVGASANVVDFKMSPFGRYEFFGVDLK
jgi:dipeptide transport system substrate-binding protein